MGQQTSKNTMEVLTWYIFFLKIMVVLTIQHNNKHRLYRHNLFNSFTNIALNIAQTGCKKKIVIFQCIGCPNKHVNSVKNLISSL